MQLYKFAELVIGLDCTYGYTYDLCQDYRVSGENADINISVSEQEIEREQGEALEEYPKQYLESLAVYRQLGEKAVDYDVLIMHASVIAVDGKAYLFTAPSGTGKSTHTSLWKQYFGERAVIVNDDKPLIRFLEDGIKAYGTPWDGKHKRSSNTSVEIQAVCVLEQGEKNEIHKLSKQEAYVNILNQIYRINDRGKMNKILALIDRFVKDIPVYKMKCDISKEAVITSYEAMSNE